MDTGVSDKEVEVHNKIAISVREHGRQAGPPCQEQVAQFQATTPKLQVAMVYVIDLNRLAQYGSIFEL